MIIILHYCHHYNTKLKSKNIFQKYLIDINCFHATSLNKYLIFKYYKHNGHNNQDDSC